MALLRLPPAGQKRLPLRSVGTLGTWSNTPADSTVTIARALAGAVGTLTKTGTGNLTLTGGDPTPSRPNKPPAVTRDASDNLVLTFTRAEDSIGAATLTLEYGTDLAGTSANSFVIGAAGGTDSNGVTVAIGQVASPDVVTVTIPAALASPAGKIFTRLKATQP